MKKTHIQHLYNRAGFGILPQELEKIQRRPRAKIVKDIFGASEKIEELTVPTPEIDSYLASTGGKIEKQDIKELLKKSRAKHLELNKAWLNRMATSEPVLRERMTFFWANHLFLKN